MPRVIIQKVELAYRGGPCDKVYHIELTEEDGGYRVTGYNGRRGTRLTTQNKTPCPVSFQLAREIYERLLRSKLRHPRTPYWITAQEPASTIAPAAPAPPAATFPLPEQTAPADYQAPHLKALEL